eukprot:4950952-Amphidinium_carterae.1
MENKHNEDDAKHATIQQLLSISYHYAPNFLDTMKLKKMDYLPQLGFSEEQVQHRESMLQQEKILELHCAIKKYTATVATIWTNSFCLHGRTEQTIDIHGTTSRHDWRYATNDFLNVFLYNHPTEYPQAAPHLRQPQYLP